MDKATRRLTIIACSTLLTIPVIVTISIAISLLYFYGAEVWAMQPSPVSMLHGFSRLVSYWSEYRKELGIMHAVALFGPLIFCMLGLTGMMFLLCRRPAGVKEAADG